MPRGKGVTRLAAFFDLGEGIMLKSLVGAGCVDNPPHDCDDDKRGRRHRQKLQTENEVTEGEVAKEEAVHRHRKIGDDRVGHGKRLCKAGAGIYTRVKCEIFFLTHLSFPPFSWTSCVCP